MSPASKHVDVCPLLVIGGGAMAGAILAGAAKADLLDGPCIVAEPDQTKRKALSAMAPSIDAVESIAAAFEALPYDDASVLLAVKPQMLPGVAEEIDAAVGERMLEDRCIISILAGVTTSRLSGALKGRVVRAMPNLPAKVGMGATAISGSENATGEDLDRAHRLFRAAGEVYDVPESAIDAFTGVAGSGPAYAFLLAEAMAAGGLEAGQEAGLTGASIRAIVAQTLRGASEMLLTEEDGKLPDPAELRAAVTSKGGTTAAALGVLEARGMRDAVRDAVLAAARRAGELGN
ncbi:MAG: pyrroline-5-carboxylate reductase [Phycisphaera sp.]|nr:MAG: pyrroline-5-carboxylate reductase [Phycisphaera sp.]